MREILPGFRMRFESRLHSTTRVTMLHVGRSMAGTIRQYDRLALEDIDRIIMFLFDLRANTLSRFYQHAGSCCTC